MKRFKSIAEWLKTNPSPEEQDKVLILIHRGATSQIRRELWGKERYLLKLQAFANHCKKLGFAVPKEETETQIKTKKEIEELRKDLPVIPKKEKKEKTKEYKETEIAAPVVEN